MASELTRPARGLAREPDAPGRTHRPAPRLAREPDASARPAPAPPLAHEPDAPARPAPAPLLVREPDASAPPAAAPAAARAATTADRVSRAAFEAGLLGVAAAALYSLLLIALRTTGAAELAGVAACALLLLGVAAARRDPGAAFAALGRGTAAALALGTLVAAALTATGLDGRLLFLPALLTLCTLGAATGPRRALGAAALATAGLLAPLLTDPHAVTDRRLLALSALGLLAIPPLLALLAARAEPQAPAPTPAPTQPPPASSGEFRSLSDQNPPLLDTAPPPATAPAPASPLTPRQLDAVALTAAGLRHAEIAERLGVSVHQVRRLLRQGRERVHASTTRELVAWAMMEGIVGPRQGTETETRPSDD